jgi:hypothetical protein
MKISSSAFQDGDPVPKKYTGDGQDISPPLRFSGVPAEARELALIVDDPDAPSPQPWVHWVMYKIPAEVDNLPEGVNPSLRVSQPGHALQGKNSWDRIGYGGPAPPEGHGTHHYYFKLYALDEPLSLEPGLDKEALLAAMKGHIITEAQVVGTYER